MQIQAKTINRPKHHARSIPRGKFSIDTDSGQLVGVKRGYYLVVERTQERFWFASSFWEAVSGLEAACKQHLGNDDYRYWVDYSYGLDVDRKVAWDNLDQTDALLDCGA